MHRRANHGDIDLTKYFLPDGELLKKKLKTLSAIRTVDRG